APGIGRARLFEALDREHRSAVALQRSLLPDRLPDLAGIETAARYLPARDEVGGDWYDVIDLPGGELGAALGEGWRLLFQRDAPARRADRRPHRRPRRSRAAGRGAHGPAAHRPARLRA